jgi:hypothetical protein
MLRGRERRVQREGNRISLALGIIAILIAYRTNLQVQIPGLSPGVSYVQTWPISAFVDLLTISLGIYAVCMFIFFSDDLDSRISKRVNWRSTREAFRKFGTSLFLATLLAEGVVSTMLLFSLAIGLWQYGWQYKVVELIPVALVIALMVSSKLRVTARDASKALLDLLGLQG